MKLRAVEDCFVKSILASLSALEVDARFRELETELHQLTQQAKLAKAELEASQFPVPNSSLKEFLKTQMDRFLIV
jgi:hypothetical protein